MTGENGQEEAKEPKFLTVVVGLSLDPWAVKVQVGDTPLQLEQVLSILEAAHREIEADWKLQKTLQLQQQLKQAAEDQRRTDAILDKVAMRRH